MGVGEQVDSQLLVLLELPHVLLDQQEQFLQCLLLGFEGVGLESLGEWQLGWGGDLGDHGGVLV